MKISKEEVNYLGGVNACFYCIFKSAFYPYLEISGGVEKIYEAFYKTILKSRFIIIYRKLTKKLLQSCSCSCPWKC